MFAALDVWGDGLPQYSWNTITAAQALAFTSADSTFSTNFGGGVTIRFDDANERVIVDDGFGRSVTFGGGAYGATLIFAYDGTNIVLGTPRADFFAISSSITVFAGGGADILALKQISTRASGGAGDDLFVLDSGLLSSSMIPTILDWEVGDRLRFSATAGSATNYIEATYRSETEGSDFAKQQIASGAADYVAIETDGKVLVFADSRGDNGQAEVIVTLAGRTLADISFSNIVGGDAPTAPSPPPAGPSPSFPTSFDLSGSVGGDMDQVRLSDLLALPILSNTATLLQISNGGSTSLGLRGQGLTYDRNAQITGGQITSIDAQFGAFTAHVSLSGLSAVSFGRWVQTNATEEAFATIFAGNDSLSGGPNADLIRTHAGSDVIQGYGGANTIFGGAGDDFIYGYASTNATFGTPGANYLRGDEGNDMIVGGSDFDDINGNMGNDTGSGGLGDDWVVGGKDNDSLSGGAGYDLVYGNIGADTCDGGDGNDIVRGGQDDDVVLGGTGVDFVSGDKGSDTMTGGSGADVFHSFGDAGLDRVTDFSLAEGDRVQLDPGTQYTVAQVGADTVINMTGGGQMILVGVQMSSLTSGWIFGA